MPSRLKKPEMPADGEALPGRPDVMPVPQEHFVDGHPLTPPFPQGLQLPVGLLQG